MKTDKHVPGKRIKSMHRAARREGVTNRLRSFARALASSTMPGHETAVRWLEGKRIKAEV